jgi:hypothetical protein
MSSSRPVVVAVARRKARDLLARAARVPQEFSSLIRDHGDRKKGSTFGFDATAQIRILQPWLGQQVDLSAE